MTDFTKKFRRTTYDTINPLAAANSQSGRTVLVVGASEGIGLNIAQAYIEADARELIISSRSEAKLDSAVNSLKQINSECRISALVSDASDIPQIETLWQTLTERGLFIDVLVSESQPASPIRKLETCLWLSSLVCAWGAVTRMSTRRRRSGGE